jgi:hypothetical protein
VRTAEEAEMPELRLREVHLPELHLPEMSRDDIARAIGDARRDLPDVELPKVDMPKFDMTKVDLSKVDVAKAVTTAAQAVGLVRATRRPRLPFVVGGLVVVGLIGAVVVASPVLRPRLTELGRRVRERIDAWRAGRDSSWESTEPRAFDAAVAVPIEPSAFSASSPAVGSPLDGPSELPEGLGASVESIPPEKTPSY